MLNFAADTKDFKQLIKNLEKTGKYAFPNAVRGMLNQQVYEFTEVAKKKILPEMFALRNNFIQKTVQYDKVEGSGGKVENMAAYAGQRAEFAGKKADQLAIQEFRLRPSTKVIGYSNARAGKNMAKTISKKYYLTGVPVKTFEDLERDGVLRGPKDRKKQARTLAGFTKAKKMSLMPMVRFRNNNGNAGIYRVINGNIKLIYTHVRGGIKLKKRKAWVEAAQKAIPAADKIFREKAAAQLEKQLKAGLKP